MTKDHQKQSNYEKIVPPKVGGKKGEMENLKTHGRW
jgi:hypothetical protein